MTDLRSLTSPDWPAAGDNHPSPVMVLLHGYGSHEHDLAGLAPMLPPGIPWASLRAPLEMGYGAAAWFPLDLDGTAEFAEGVAGTALIWDWIDANVPAAAPVIPVGFSQGGMMALQMLRTRPNRVAATVVLAGFASTLVQPEDDALAQLRPTVFWARGSADPVVPIALVESTQRWCQSHVDAHTHVYPGLGHGINEEMMEDMRTYIAKTLRARS